jgi:hypothetical protein
MRMECKSYEAAERLSNLYGECHIERKGHKVYLVVDEVRRRAHG